MKQKENKFQQGYACAVACIVSIHGESAITNEALGACGLTSIKAMREYGVDEYDIKILRSSVKTLQRRKRQR